MCTTPNCARSFAVEPWQIFRPKWFFHFSNMAPKILTVAHDWLGDSERGLVLRGRCRDRAEVWSSSLTHPDDEFLLTDSRPAQTPLICP